jgi:hypothetical protein
VVTFIATVIAILFLFIFWHRSTYCPCERDVDAMQKNYLAMAQVVDELKRRVGMDELTVEI